MTLLTTATAASALGVDRQFLDLLLSREAADLLPTGRQGRSRRISDRVLEPIAVACIMRRELGVPLRRGLELARLLLGSPSGEIEVGTIGRFRVDLPALRRSLSESIAEALERTAQPRRGRPPKRRAAIGN